MRINDATLYLTDNGACYCGKHLGATARATGRDISGQKILALTPDILPEYAAMGIEPPTCERCGQAVSRIHLATA